MPDTRKPTLESRLRLRLQDTRAMIASLSINADRLFLTFGTVGENARITLRIVGDQIGLPEAFEEQAPATASEGDATTDPDPAPGEKPKSRQRATRRG